MPHKMRSFAPHFYRKRGPQTKTRRFWRYRGSCLHGYDCTECCWYDRDDHREYQVTNSTGAYASTQFLPLGYDTPPFSAYDAIAWILKPTFAVFNMQPGIPVRVTQTCDDYHTRNCYSPHHIHIEWWVQHASPKRLKHAYQRKGLPRYVLARSKPLPQPPHQEEAPVPHKRRYPISWTIVERIRADYDRGLTYATLRLRYGVSIAYLQRIVKYKARLTE